MDCNNYQVEIISIINQFKTYMLIIFPKDYKNLLKVNSKMYTKTLLWIQNMKNHHMIMTIIHHKTAFVIAMNTYPCTLLVI